MNKYSVEIKDEKIRLTRYEELDRADLLVRFAFVFIVSLLCTFFIAFATVLVTNSIKVSFIAAAVVIIPIFIWIIVATEPLDNSFNSTKNVEIEEEIREELEQLIAKDALRQEGTNTRALSKETCTKITKILEDFENKIFEDKEARYRAKESQAREDSNKIFEEILNKSTIKEG